MCDREVQSEMRRRERERERDAFTSLSMYVDVETSSLCFMSFFDLSSTYLLKTWNTDFNNFLYLVGQISLKILRIRALVFLLE